MGWDGRNRRKFPRVLFPCLIKIHGGNDDKDAILTHTENLSTGGVRVILKHPVAMGAAIDVEIDLMDIGEHLRCKGAVVWSERRKSSEEIKPDFYDIGIEFERVNDVSQKRLEQIINHHIKQGNQI
jgi:c-di-GMP-binding flagellar brake protein YcgR